MLYAVRSQTGFAAPAIVVTLLIAGLIAGVYLVQQRTNLKPKAAGGYFVCTDEPVDTQCPAANRQSVFSHCDYTIQNAAGDEIQEKSIDINFCARQSTATRWCTWNKECPAESLCKRGVNGRCIPPGSTQDCINAYGSNYIARASADGGLECDLAPATTICKRGVNGRCTPPKSNQECINAYGLSYITRQSADGGLECDINPQVTVDKNANCVINLTRDGRTVEEGVQIKDPASGQLKSPYDSLYAGCKINVIDNPGVCEHSDKTCSYAVDENGDGKADSCYKGVCKNQDCSNCGYDAACANKLGLGQKISCTGQEGKPVDATKVRTTAGTPGGSTQAACTKKTCAYSQLDGKCFAGVCKDPSKCGFNQDCIPDPDGVCGNQEVKCSEAGNYGTVYSAASGGLKEFIKLPTGILQLGADPSQGQFKRDYNLAIENYKTYRKIIDELKSKGIDVTKADQLINQGSGQADTCKAS